MLYCVAAVNNVSPYIIIVKITYCQLLWNHGVNLVLFWNQMFAKAGPYEYSTLQRLPNVVQASMFPLVGEGAGVAYIITGHEQTQLNRVCCFRFFCVQRI